MSSLANAATRKVSILMTACNAVFIYEACAEYGKCVSFAMKTSDLHIAMNIQAPILYNRQIETMSKKPQYTS